MKSTFQIELDPVSKSIFFPNYRIKDKLKILEILLESARFILYGKRELSVKGNNKIILFRDKMSRLFFVSEDKIYSIVFPFNINLIGNEITLNYKNIITIDSLSITNLIILLKSPLLNSENCLDFIEPVIELEDEQALKYWPLFRDLLFLEDGYIRYDKDEMGYYEAKKNNLEHKHPLNHIDIFYTNQATFKLGLNNSINSVDVIDILNVNTNCKFLKNCP